jgi:hypothetical protein
MQDTSLANPSSNQVGRYSSTGTSLLGSKVVTERKSGGKHTSSDAIHCLEKDMKLNASFPLLFLVDPKTMWQKPKRASR